MQVIASVGTSVGSCTPMDLRSPVYQTPMPNVSYATINQSLTVSWVRPKSIMRADFNSDHQPLDGCSHVLCVQVRITSVDALRPFFVPTSNPCPPATQCIRQWRHPSNRTDDTETTNITCPYCRVPSYFVTPSSQFFPKGHPRRVEIITQYKASMARVPCR